MKASLRLLCVFLALTFSHSLFADALILAAQQKLKTLGLYDGTVDGQSGSQTSAAIRRYQVYNKLKVTGELNPQTNEQLGIAKSTKTSDSPTSKEEDPNTAKGAKLVKVFVGGPLLTAGPEAQIQVLKKAKEKLHYLGYYNGPFNGDPTLEFTLALKNYQRRAGFKANGRLDKTTLRGLDLHEPAHDDGTY